MTRLSVLDTSPIVQGSTAREALRNTLDLALLAEELGFHRYWVPEHHGMRGVASSAPAVVVGRIAAATERSRVRGRRIQLPSPADAAAYPYRDEDRQEITVRSGGVLVGSPDTVRPLLQAVVDETGTTELMLTTPVYDHAARRRSYELVGKIAPSLR